MEITGSREDLKTQPKTRICVPANYRDSVFYVQDGSLSAELLGKF